MSGGRYDYFHARYEWNEAIEDIENQIKDNPNNFSEETLREFRVALLAVKSAKSYLKRIDYLLSGDNGESCFHDKLKDDFERLN